MRTRLMIGSRINKGFCKDLKYVKGGKLHINMALWSSGRLLVLTAPYPPLVVGNLDKIHSSVHPGVPEITFFSIPLPHSLSLFNGFFGGCGGVMTSFSWLGKKKIAC